MQRTLIKFQYQSGAWTLLFFVCYKTKLLGRLTLQNVAIVCHQVNLTHTGKSVLLYFQNRFYHKRVQEV